MQEDLALKNQSKESNVQFITLRGGGGGGGGGGVNLIDNTQSNQDYSLSPVLSEVRWHNCFFKQIVLTEIRTENKTPSPEPRQCMVTKLGM